MAYSSDQLSDIFDRTSGRCHICHSRLAFTNYGRAGRRGAWEVEHSVPRARGGTDRKNNLYAACITCNRGKQHRSTKVARYAAGTRRAPLNTEKRKGTKVRQAIGYGTAGAFLGGIVAGPPGAVLGAMLGGSYGHRRDPDHE